MLQQGCEAHFGQCVEAVVARRAVGAQADRDAGLAQADDVGDPGTELEIRARAVHDAEPGGVETLQVRWLDLHAMGDAQALRQDALLVEILDFVPSPLQPPHRRGLLALLQGVRVDRPAAVDGEIAQAPPEFVRAAEDEARVEDVAQPAAVAAVEGVAELGGMGQCAFGLLA